MLSLCQTCVSQMPNPWYRLPLKLVNWRWGRDSASKLLTKGPRTKASLIAWWWHPACRTLQWSCPVWRGNQSAFAFLLHVHLCIYIAPECSCLVDSQALHQSWPRGWFCWGGRTARKWFCCNCEWKLPRIWLLRRDRHYNLRTQVSVGKTARTQSMNE